MQLAKNYGMSGQEIFQSMHPIKDATDKNYFACRPNEFQSMHPIKDATY